MSKINDLIKQYCPDGVEWKELWELTIWDKKLVGVDKAKQSSIIKFNQVSAEILKNIKQNKDGNIRLLSTGIYSGYTTEDCIDNKKIINNAEVISLPSGGSVSLKYYNGSFIDSGNILAVSADTNKYCLKYIFYYLLNKKYLIELMYRGAGIQHPSMSEILQIKIPLPPLPVQQEIVNILDKFTELEAELEAELEGRKKQYEHYRNTLLTFGDDVEWKELGEVCEKILAGGDLPKEYDMHQSEQFKYPIYSNGTKEKALYGYTNSYKIDKEAITISARGTIGYHEIRPANFTPIVRLITVIPNTNKILIKFLNYILDMALNLLYHIRLEDNKIDI